MSFAEFTHYSPIRPQQRLEAEIFALNNHNYTTTYRCPPQYTLTVAFLPANGLCSFISSCAVNYLPAPFPVFLQQPGPCTRRWGGVEGGEETSKRGGLLSSDIVIKESPQPAGPAHSHTVVWLPDILSSTRTAVGAVKGETHP